MDTASIAHLKARLSRYLMRVKGGRELVITERGIPIAKIVPLNQDEGATRLHALAQAGLVRPGRGHVRKSLLKPPQGQAAEGAGVLSALLSERRNAR
jgi:prevent-host-death family protein